MGEPSWAVEDLTLVDGRSRFAKRYWIVKFNDFFNDIEQGWSRFKSTANSQELFCAASECVNEVITVLSSTFVKDASEDALVKTGRDSRASRR